MKLSVLILRGSLALFCVLPITAASQTKSAAKTIDLGDVNNLAVKMPLLNYPRKAQIKGVHGIVRIRLWINKKGDVIKAKVLSGPQLLRSTSLRGARQSKFPVNLGSCDSCRYVTGVLTFTFVKQEPNTNQ